jgi:predicted NAD/FAD-dependent oxidoreductase
MATRRIDSALFDHGAQFFTVRSKQLQSYVDKWLEINLIREWTRGFDVNQDGHPRYIGVNGMNSIARYLSKNLQIIINQRVLFLNFNENRQWQILTDREELFQGEALILTPPVPQSISLLQSGNMNQAEEIFDQLEGIEYDSCLGLLALIEGKSPFEFPGAKQLSGEPVSWIADNQLKGISSAGPAITVHAGPEFSRKYWEMDDDSVIQNMMYIASDWIKAKFKTYQLKRWRYSQPRVIHEERTVYFKNPLPIAFAGDAFGGPRIEGAALSGIRSAERIAAAFI